jgi:hypothetical protein
MYILIALLFNAILGGFAFHENWYPVIVAFYTVLSINAIIFVGYVAAHIVDSLNTE